MHNTIALSTCTRNTVCTKRNASYAYSLIKRTPLKIIILTCRILKLLCLLSVNRVILCFRHFHNMFSFVKQKVANTICDDQSSYPLIYRRRLPFHIFERLFIIFKCPSVIVTTFASHSDQWHCWIHRQKHCEEDRHRNSQRIANQAFYPVRVNECPNENNIALSHIRLRLQLSLEEYLCPKTKLYTVHKT